MSTDNEWSRGSDGILERHAARIVAFDENGRILLLKGHDSAQPERAWWFTIGGGVALDEDVRRGAVREFFEETGVMLDPDSLVGPVVKRTGVFHFLHHDRRQFELFFLATLSADEVEATSTWMKDGLTDLERDVLDEMRWMDLDELEAEAEHTEVFPRELPTLARCWIAGWSGDVAEIVES